MKQPEAKYNIPKFSLTPWLYSALRYRDFIVHLNTVTLLCGALKQRGLILRLDTVTLVRLSTVTLVHLNTGNLKCT